MQLSWGLTSIVIGLACLFALLLGLDVTWKLVALIACVGFMTEIAMQIADGSR